MLKRISRSCVYPVRFAFQLLLVVCLTSLNLFAEEHQEPQPDFEIKILKVGMEGGIFHLRGIAKNVSGRTCAMAEISYNVFDDEGNAIGTLTDAKPNFQAGSTWKFDAVSGSDEGRYELIAANCY